MRGDSAARMSGLRIYRGTALLVALTALVGAPATRTAAAAGRDTLSAAVDGGTRVVQHEMTVEDLRAWTRARFEASDWLPGTEYTVMYLIDQEAQHCQIGDRIQVTCLALQSDYSSTPCDSVRINAALGRDQLPIGIEWALMSPADLAHPVSMQRELLDRRFTRCGGDGRGVHFLRLRVDRCDTTGRADPRSQKLTRAFQCFVSIEQSGIPDLEFLHATLERNRNSTLVRVLYAGALRASGRCEEYFDQMVDLYKRGYASHRPVREREMELCKNR